MTHTQPEALRFTKKPVTIVASQWFKSGDHPAVRDISDSDDLFFTGMAGATLVERGKFGVIGTLESPNHLVTPGDWIITGVQGEHYPCKPDIFEATYAPETKLQQGKCLHQIDEPQTEALRLADKYEIEGFLQDHRFAKDHWCRQAAAELRRQHARIEELEDAIDIAIKHVFPAAQGMDAMDTIRLNWLDAQVKNHAVHNGFLWQEGGWESDRGLVCAIQGKKQKKTVRQAIDAAMAAQAEQGEQS